MHFVQQRIWGSAPFGHFSQIFVLVALRAYYTKAKTSHSARTLAEIIKSFSAAPKYGSLSLANLITSATLHMPKRFEKFGMILPKVFDALYLVLIILNNALFHGSV